MSNNSFILLNVFESIPIRHLKQTKFWSASSFVPANSLNNADSLYY